MIRKGGTPFAACCQKKVVHFFFFYICSRLWHSKSLLQKSRKTLLLNSFRMIYNDVSWIGPALPSIQYGEVVTLFKTFYSNWCYRKKAFRCFNAYSWLRSSSKESTMLQKLSKCEVKSCLCWNLIILSSLRFYVKSNFGEFKWWKNVNFGHFSDSEFLF